MSCVSRALPDLTARRRKIRAILSKVDVHDAAAYRASMVPTGSGGIAAFTASRRDRIRAVTPCRCAVYASKKRVEDPPGGFRFLSPRRKEQRDGCEQYGNVHKKTRSSGESFPYGRNPLFRRGNRCIDQISPVTSRNTGRSARWVLGLCSESISRPSGVRKSMPWPPWSRKRGGSCRKGPTMSPLSDAARPWA